MAGRSVISGVSMRAFVAGLEIVFWCYL